MDPITRQGISVAAGAGGGDPLYVDDVFSTFLYEGNGGSTTAVAVNNGIDLSGEGGLLWIKNRVSSHSNALTDDSRGTFTNGNGNQTLPVLTSNSTSTQLTNVVSTLFTSTGFTTKYSNSTGDDYVSWSFRKAPGFFDVVTYTGNGTAGRTVSHNLGSVPGFIIVKKVSSSGNWACYHRSLGATKYIRLNSTDGSTTLTEFWNDTAPTSSNFTVGSNTNVNQNGETYVAYVFAHDDQSFGTDSDESIIKCGSFTTDGSSSATIDLGFEPQWLMYKSASTGGQNWQILDVMRGWSVRTSGMQELYANSSSTEVTNNGTKPTPTGFLLDGGHSNNATYIYMAIRRPHKPPTAGTDVFAPQTTTPEQVRWTPGFAPDALFATRLSGTSRVIGARLTGAQSIMYTNSSSSETSGTDYLHWDELTGTIKQTALQSGSSTGLHYAFKRAPGFFDVVAYTGTGSNATHSHNLDAVPELIIVKCRSNNGGWAVYNAINGASKGMLVNGNSGAFTYNPYWNSTTPTATQFTVATDGAVNSNTETYVAYLFATLDGISKVGSYSGTGYDINVDCGFTAGARFVMIKRTDSTGDWYVWDTTRGIVSGNDPYFLFNSTAAQTTSTDYIDPLNAGFTVTSSAPAALNASGGTYLFLAIA
tara:strand:+ start:451 stop:2388 length:1938 start_codon:yes stop_codon:yes gene_type:complete